MGSNGDFYHHIRYHTFPIVLSYFTFKRLYIPKIKSISHKDSPFATTFDTLLNFPIYSLAETKILRSKKYIVSTYSYVSFVQNYIERQRQDGHPGIDISILQSIPILQSISRYKNPSRNFRPTHPRDARQDDPSTARDNPMKIRLSSSDPDDPRKENRLDPVLLPPRKTFLSESREKEKCFATLLLLLFFLKRPRVSLIPY